MILPPRSGVAPRGRSARSRQAEPTLRSIVVGTCSFLLIAAICLYAAARLGS